MITTGTDLLWRKSSHSHSGGGQCVELAMAGERGFIRDSKRAELSSVLSFPQRCLCRFAKAAGYGAFRITTGE